jgi:hypothetical protein
MDVIKIKMSFHKEPIEMRDPWVTRVAGASASQPQQVDIAATHLYEIPIL